MEIFCTNIFVKISWNFHAAFTLQGHGRVGDTISSISANVAKFSILPGKCVSIVLNLFKTCCIRFFRIQQQKSSTWTATYRGSKFGSALDLSIAKFCLRQQCKCNIGKILEQFCQNNYLEFEEILKTLQKNILQDLKNVELILRKIFEDIINNTYTRKNFRKIEEKLKRNLQKIL